MFGLTKKENTLANDIEVIDKLMDAVQLTKSDAVRAEIWKIISKQAALYAEVKMTDVFESMGFIGSKETVEKAKEVLTEIAKQESAALWVGDIDTGSTPTLSGNTIENSNVTTKRSGWFSDNYRTYYVDESGKKHYL